MTERDERTEIERKLEEEAAARKTAAIATEPVTFVPYSGSAAPNTPLDPESGAALRTAGSVPARPSTLHRTKDRGGVIGWIAGALLLLFKYIAPALKFVLLLKPFLLTFGTMAVSMWAYSTQFGWRFGVGLVLLIFFHECGHATAGIIKGHKPGMMVFVPFMGAFVTTKGFGRSIVTDAFIGIMGPVFGAIGGLICCGLYAATADPFYMTLAYFNFFMNLFNLAPTVPLDGGWIVPLFSPKLLAIGAVLMVVLGFRNPMIWVLGLMSLPRIIGGWKADPATQPYYRVSTGVKIGYGLAYVGLACFLALSMVASSAIVNGFIRP